MTQILADNISPIGVTGASLSTFERRHDTDILPFLDGGEESDRKVHYDILDSR